MDERACRLIVKRRAVSVVLEVDEYSEFLPCEGCGTYVNALEMHHRKFRSRGGLWLPSGIIALCKSCHDNATVESLWAQACGWNVHSWEDPLLVPVQLCYVDSPVCLDNQGGYSPCCEV